MGRDLYALRIGHGPKEIHFNAAMHANEWITAPLVMQFVEDLACSYARGTAWEGRNIRRILSEYSLWVVPMVNPDGVELVLHGLTEDHPYREALVSWNKGSSSFINWKANIRGVDLNDQFPAHWEEEKARREHDVPGERDYGGEAPLSEPEAAALALFTDSHQFELVVALHTQGREIYWNYRVQRLVHSKVPPTRIHGRSRARRQSAACRNICFPLRGSRPDPIDRVGIVAESSGR
ncbi:Gamma-D-glutamyl-L-diamino acid endopeptidase 1 [compost metagenome]